MHIGIDARFFGPAETGIGRYVERLISHLGDIDQTNTYTVFLRRRAFETWTPPNARWRKVLADYRWYSVAEQVFMPGIFRKEHCDLIHVPHFNVPLLMPRPYIVTVHDLILSRFPTARASTLAPWLYRLKHWAYQLNISYAVRRAARIIAVSEYAKNDICQTFHVSSDHVTVTYESVDPLPPPVSTAVLTSHGVTTPYVLHVGNSYPHKNLPRLITAVRRLRDEGESLTLVLVGKRDYFSRRLEAEFGHGGGVVWYGFASDEELAALYHHAAAYVFPSLSEGFGLPGLEAMSASLPVIAARASCLPEVFGAAAAYFDPLDVASIAASIRRVVRDTMERQRLVAAGHERLHQFSWERMARQTFEIYTNTHGAPAASIQS